MFKTAQNANWSAKTSAETVDDYDAEPVEFLAVTQEDKLWAMLAHLCGILGWALPVPIAQIVGPLVIYLIFKNKSQYVAFHALQSLYLQVGFVVAVVAAIALGIVTFGLGFIVLIPLAAGLIVIAIVLPIIAAVKANRGELYEYPIVGQLVRDNMGF